MDGPEAMQLAPARGPGTVAARELAAEEIPPLCPAGRGPAGALYTALTWLASPVVGLHIAARRLKGRETDISVCERWGFNLKERPPGPVVWFHAVSIGESAVALPVIHRCLEEYEDITVVLTTGTVEAYSLLSHAVPPEKVKLQFAPLDIPLIAEAFIRHWKPCAAVFVESELWPNLVRLAHVHGVKLALLNARMSTESFMKWHKWTAGRSLVGGILSHFSLIVPQSDLDVGRFRLLGAQLWQMPGWCADLKYAAAMGSCVWQMWRPSGDRVELLREGIGHRQCWVAASTHEGEEVLAGRAHLELTDKFPDILTVVVPRHPWRCACVKSELEALSLRVRLWSSADPSNAEEVANTDIYVVDMVGELPLLFSVADISFIGGSMFNGSRGHNLAEAAVAGCAVLVGPHAGHFTQMAEELNIAAREASAAPTPGFHHEEPPLLRFWSPDVSLSSVSPLRRFGSSDVARGLQRRRPTEGDESQGSPGGLESLEDELSGRPGYVRGRRATRNGGTPGAWGSTNGIGSGHSSPAGSPRFLPRFDSHSSTPERLNINTSATDGSGMDRAGSRLSAMSRGGQSEPSPTWSESSPHPQSVDIHAVSSDLAQIAHRPPSVSPVTPRVRPLGLLSVDETQPMHSPAFSIASTEPSGPSVFSTPAHLTGSPSDFQSPNGEAASRARDMSGGPVNLDEIYARGAAIHTSREPRPNTPQFQRNFEAAVEEYFIPAHMLPSHPLGPCVWTVANEEQLVSAVGALLASPKERRSRGKAASEAAASLATNLVSTVWELLDMRIIKPALAEDAKRVASTQ